MNQDLTERMLGISEITEGEDWDYTWAHPHDQLIHNALYDRQGKVVQKGPNWKHGDFNGARVRVYTEHQEKVVKQCNGIPVWKRRNEK